MALRQFDLEVALPRAKAFDLLDRHYRGLGYRVEESDRMNFRLVMDRGGILVAFADDLHLVCHHKGRIEAKAEMPDDAGILSGVLVFVQELFSS